MKFPEWSEEWLREVADAEPGGLMACSPELLREMKVLAKDDPAIAATLELAGIKPEHVERVVIPLTPEFAKALAAFNAGREYTPLRDGEPCSHPGCLSHLTHPCEGCGRVDGRWEGGNEALS